MKRLLSALLMLTFVFYLPVCVHAEDSLPAVGEKLHGFTVAEQGNVRLIDAETVLFSHDKTGGLVLYIASEDMDRSFDISFKTPKLDSRGIPHVFEHICISGSEKYPSQNLFFPMASQTYNTFVNAMTYDTMTTYPMSSLSEDQLLKLADYYLDGVFNPMVYTEERLFNREAWRYELADADAPLTLTGTVYNEMKGTQSIETAAYYNVLDALFPDSIVSNINGGDPDYITEMTWQALLDFHEAYYHPSNALVILYGDLDYERFLKLIDKEYFSKYDKREVFVETGEIEPLSTPVDMTCEFPVEKTSTADNASIISYSSVANGASFEDNIGLAILSAVLTHESSPLIQAMRSELPNSNISASYSFITNPTPYLSISGNGLNKEDKETFVNIITDSLEKIISDGVDQKIVDALMAAERFSNLTLPEMSNLGVNLSVTLALMWTQNGTLNYYNDYLDTIDLIEAKADEGYFEDLIEKYILSNDHNAVVVTTPAAGMAEEKAAALAASLEEIKAAMSDEEIAAMIKQTADFDEWSKEEASPELIQGLQAIDVKSLPEETKAYEITDEERDGVRFMTVEAAVADIGRTALFFNTSAVAEEDLHYLNLYASLIGQVATENYPLTELQTLMTQYLNSFSVSAGTLDQGEFDYEPVISASWMSLNDDYETCIDLVGELLFKTDVSDIDTVKGIVGRLKNAKRSEINSMPYNYQYSRAMATGKERNAYTSYLSGFDYYRFLTEAEVLLNENPEEFTSRLRTVADSISVRDKAKVLFAGNGSGIKIFEDSIEKVFEGLSDEPLEATGYDFELLSPEREAIIVDSTVQYNVLHASAEQLGIEYSGKLQPMARLIYDAYLTPQIRHGIGAYDNIVQFNKQGITLISYRDPSVTDTYEVYEGLSEFVETAEFTQEDLDRYILSTYSGYAAPTGELSGAVNAMTLRLTGEPDDIILKTMREIKSFEVDDLKGMAEVFDKLNEVGFRSTAGGSAVIDRNADLFERVIDIAAMTPGDASQGLTRAELISLIFGGMEGSLEQAKAAGIIVEDEDGNYDEQEQVTREEFAVMLLRALGLPEAEFADTAADYDSISAWATAAVDTILAYGIMQLDESGCFNPGGGVTNSDFEAALTQIYALSGAA